MSKRPELGPTQEALPALAAVEFAELPRGYPLLSALEPAASTVRRGQAPPRSGVAAPSPALKPATPVKGVPKAGARGQAKEPPPPPATDDPLPRPKKGEDEDLLQ